MSAHENRCVFCAETVELAGLVADLLCQHGIQCEVVELAKSSSQVTIPDILRSMMNPYGSSLPDKREELRAATAGIDVMYGAIVRVMNSEQVLAGEYHLFLHSGRIERWRRELTVVVTCDECCFRNAFPRKLSGTVQSCRYCLRFLDIPGDDPEWEGLDWRQGGEPDS